MDNNKYRVLYDNGDGVLFYWGPNGGEPTTVDKAVDLIPSEVPLAVIILMREDTGRVVVERVGLSDETKPGPVPTFVYDREEADQFHEQLDAPVSVYSRGGRFDTEAADEGWVEMKRSDWYELRRLANKYPDLVSLKPGLRGS